MTAVRYQASWLAHALPGRRNPLCRTVDRIAAAISALLVAGAVLAIAATVPFGAMLHNSMSHRASRAAATTHPVTATLTTDAEAGVGTTAVNQTYAEGVALIQWNTPNGPRSTAINVPLNSVRGQSTTIWTDESGNMVPAPAGPGAATWAALFGASGALLVTLLSCVGLIGGTQYLARRYAQRAWGREWAAMQRWRTLSQ